jgi:hypothetical protein
MAKSDYLENKFLNHVLKVSSFTVPTNIYLALYTDATSDAGGGTEVTGGSYARVVANSWASASGGASSNSAVIDFPGMPAVTVTHIALYDASSGGNRLYHGALTTPKVVPVGETLRFAIGELDVTES